MPDDVTSDRDRDLKALRGIWSEQDTGTDALMAARRDEHEAEERKAEERGAGAPSRPAP
jgi:hypothetical protein